MKSSLCLNDGNRIPQLGLGVWKSGEKTESAVLAALKAGYRHIDTAAIYYNEESVGKAIIKSGISRKDIFITTKLWNDDHVDPCRALEKSLKKLNLKYVDLYLMHWPVKQRNETWKILEQLKDEGKCRSIGVSNFTIRHLKELISKSKAMPAVNQVEFNPYLYQKELLDFCKLKNIQLEAYSPLTHNKKLKDRKLCIMADKYSKTPAQILIRWSLQKRIVVIPKSTREERIKENCNVFDFSISNDDVNKIDDFNENLRTCWDPTNVQ